MEYFLDCDLDYDESSTWNVISATALCKSSMIYATDIGHFCARKNYFTTRKGLNSYLLKFTISGGAQLNYNNSTYSVKPGEFFWIDCNQPHSYRTDPDVKSWDVLWFHFTGITATAYYNQFLRYTQNRPVASLPPNSPVINLVSSLEELYASEETQLNKDISASGYITQIAANCVTAAASDSEKVPPVVQAICQHLMMHYKERITLEALSEKFHLSQYYLQRYFKRYVGQSPSEYITHLRMKKAKELLCNTSMSISEISYALGIENASHFTRRFKALEGITPQDFRKIWPTV